MLQLCSLASGSKGNATLVSSASTTVLIDCGLNPTELRRRLHVIGAGLISISAIIITHEHGDHIRGLEQVARLTNAPVFLHHKTFSALNDNCKLGRNTNLFDGSSELSVGNLKIKPIELPHDSAVSVGFRLDDGADSLIYATDLGYVPASLVTASNGARLAFLESNHDLNMLMKGPYPAYLKRRIASNNGHLSNDISARAGLEMLRLGVKKFVLAHLSQENNLAYVARETYRDYFMKNGAKLDEDYSLVVASQDAPTGWIC